MNTYLNALCIAKQTYVIIKSKYFINILNKMLRDAGTADSSINVIPFSYHQSLPRAQREHVTKRKQLFWQHVLRRIWILLHTSHCCHKLTIASLTCLTSITHACSRKLSVPLDDHSLALLLWTYSPFH